MKGEAKLEKERERGGERETVERDSRERDKERERERGGKRDSGERQ